MFFCEKISSLKVCISEAFGRHSKVHANKIKNYVEFYKKDDILYMILCRK